MASCDLYAVVFWGSNMKVAGTNRVDKLIRGAGSALELELDPLHSVLQRKCFNDHNYCQIYFNTPQHYVHPITIIYLFHPSFRNGIILYFSWCGSFPVCGSFLSF